LRPASPLISKRHCAVLTRGGKVLVRDFDSTNGTFLNGQRVKGEKELQNQDVLKVGPLEFRVVLETIPPVSKPTPAPAPAASTDDDAAALLLSLQESSTTGSGTAEVDGDGIPTGSTVMDVLAPAAGDTPPPEDASGGAKRAEAAKLAQGNTSSAAKAILEKYMRRPRK
jgi:pSer/pThr/pTyr-binding forkhead associated (FHA) protein